MSLSRRAATSLFASTALAGLIASTAANAGSFGLHEQSVVGLGQAFAGMAAPGLGLSGMYWNPAIITSVPGINTEFNLIGIVPSSHLDNVTANTFVSTGPIGSAAGVPLAPVPGASAFMLSRGNGGDLAVNGLVPGSYGSYQLNNEVFIGLSVNAPYGFSTDLGRFAGNFDTITSRVYSVNFQPVIAYKVNEQLSVAVGMQIQWFRVSAFQDMFSLPPLSEFPVATHLDDWGVGFTLGATWKPFEGTALGIGYRSPVSNTLTGSQSFTGPALLAPGVTLAPGAYPASAKITLPDVLTVGLRQQINPQLAMSAGVEWTQWSRIGTVPVNLTTPFGSIAPGVFKFNYKDGWLFSLGADYKIDPNWTVRAGIGYEIAPTRDAFRSARLPDSNRLWLSAGLTYDFSSRLSLSASYAYLKWQSAPINVSQTYFVDGLSPTGFLTANYTATAHSDAHFVGVSVKYRWDEPPPVVGAPVIAKF